MNLPNKITLTRILLVPLMMFFYLADFIPYGKIIATILFILGAYTDHLDGFIARKHNLITDLGKFLDPVADKMLTTISLILISVDGTVPAPFGVIVLSIFIARDLVISALRQISATKGTVIAADIWGKYKTFTQCVGLPILMFYSALLSLNVSNVVLLSVFMWIGYTVLGISTLLTIISGVNYVVKNKKALK